MLVEVNRSDGARFLIDLIFEISALKRERYAYILLVDRFIVSGKQHGTT